MSTLTAPLTSFTNAAILKTIGHDRLNKFLLEFVDDLSAANLSLPDHNPCCGDEYFNALAALIASPALPERPRLALQFLELLVSPEHIDRLNAEINRHLPCVSFPFDGPPVDRALELWFARPQSMVALAAEIDQSLAPIRDNSSNSCLPRPSQTEAGPSVPIQNLESKIQDPDGSAAGDSLFGPIGETDQGRGVDSSPISPPTPEIQTPKPKTQNRLPRLSSPDVIEHMGYYLDQFFNRFQKELAARNIAHPLRYGERSRVIEAYAKILGAPDLLPPAMLDALLAIEEFSAPANTRLLEKLAGAARVDTTHEPEGWATALWLRCPYDLHYIETLKNHLPTDFFDDDEVFDDPDDADTPAPRNSDRCPSALNAQPSAIFELPPCPRNRIARLPADVRNSISEMLAQRVTYAEIIERLGEVGKTLNKSNLWRWKKGPFQHWLRTQERLEESRGQLKFALQAVRQNENNQIHQATQQLAALRISELFSQFDVASLKQAVATDPATLVRLAMLLPKLSQGGLECERQRIELAQCKPAPEKPPRKKRGISNKALRHCAKMLKLM